MITCTPVSLPSDLDADLPEVREWLESCDLISRANAARWGEGLLRRTPTERLAAARARGAQQRLFRLHQAGHLIGEVVLMLPGDELSHLIEGGCALDPGLPEQTVGEVAVLVRDLLERTARDTGRGEIWAESDATCEGINPQAPDVRPLLEHGYQLDQITRSSVLHLDRLAGLDRRLAQACVRTPELELLHWQAPTPARYVEQLCRLHEQMAADEPGGDHDACWTVERLIEDERQAGAGGGQLLIVVAQDPSGELVGWSQLLTAPDGTARQRQTLVVPAHRGRGLGVRLKLANLEALAANGGMGQRVLSFTAETNTAIHRVNDAVGFVPVHWAASWTRNSRDAERPRD